MLNYHWFSQQYVILNCDRWALHRLRDKKFGNRDFSDILTNCKQKERNDLL